MFELGPLGWLKWYQWLILLVCGIVTGLLVIIVINTHRPSGQSQEQKVAQKVAKLVILPTDETPALATVTDPQKLKYDAFLAQTRSGDQILIYAKWKQAVIYRPSDNKIVDIGPVNVNPPAGSTQGYSPLN